MPQIQHSPTLVLTAEQLLAQIDAVRDALQRWKQVHAELVAALKVAPLQGWLASGESLQPVPETVLRALDAMEYHAGDRPLQAIGLIRVPAELAPLILDANAARQALDEVSLPLRKLLRRDLERLPEGAEVGGGHLSSWVNLSPAMPVWKAVLATLEEPRLYLAQVTRQLLPDGLILDDLPEGLGFCWTLQRVVRAVTFEEVRATLEEMVAEEGANADLAREDIARLDAIGQQFGRIDLAYIYRGQHVPSVNLSWADGRSARKLAPLPVFWAGPTLPDCPPLPAEPYESRRRPRKDRKYTLGPVLRTLQVHAAITGLDERALLALCASE